MNTNALGAGLIVFLALLIPVSMSATWQSEAASRLAGMEADPDQPRAAIAANADEAYCTPELRTILRRVLTSCGLIGGGGRGCQPLEARNVATMAGGDFNALFVPMNERGGIVQFDLGSSELDPRDTTLIESVFAERRGASYFFVVARASPDGSNEHNRELSRARAEAVMSHLETHFADPDLASEVGLLWLGEEYAQLDPGFCGWSRSGEAGQCEPADLNRSAFIAWIDCRL